MSEALTYRGNQSKDAVKLRPRVVLVTNGFTPNRVPLWNALNRLCSLTVVFLSPTEKGRMWELALDRIEAETHVAGSRQVFFRRMDWAFSFAFRGVVSILEELQPDAIVISGYESPGYWASQGWARRHGIPTVLWIGSTLLSSRMLGWRMLDKMKRRFISRCDAYYTYGKLASDYVRYHGGQADRIVTGINHTNVNHFQSCERLGRYTHCALLYVGRLLPQKGVTELFTALGGLADLSWDITVAGDGPLRSELEAVSRREDFADRIQWEGHIQQRKLSDIYRKADVLVLPSLNEVWGLVVNEALLSGVYVIGSNRAAASLELIEDQQNGCLVEPNPLALEAAIRDAIERAPFDRARIRNSIAQVTPQSEATKILRAIELASAHVCSGSNSTNPG